MVILLALLLALPRIAPEAAKDHVVERVEVCGKVTDARYLKSARGQPTFLNFGDPYPKQTFTAVIWGKDRNQFDKPEDVFPGKRVCVTGTVEAYRGRPQMVIGRADQVSVE